MFNQRLPTRRGAQSGTLRYEAETHLLRPQHEALQRLRVSVHLIRSL